MSDVETDEDSIYFKMAQLKDEEFKAICKNNKRKEPMYLYMMASELRQYKDYLEKHNIPIPIDLQNLAEVLEQNTEQRHANAARKFEIGRQVHALWILGCSRNQAINAIKDYYKYGETTVMNAHTMVKNAKRAMGSSNDIIELFNMRHFDFFKEKTFPVGKRKYPKAYEAYQKIHEVQNYIANDSETLVNWLSDNAPEFFERGFRDL